MLYEPIHFKLIQPSASSLNFFSIALNKPVFRVVIFSGVVAFYETGAWCSYICFAISRANWSHLEDILSCWCTSFLVMGVLAFKLVALSNEAYIIGLKNQIKWRRFYDFCHLILSVGFPVSIYVLRNILVMPTKSVIFLCWSQQILSQRPGEGFFGGFNGLMSSSHPIMSAWPT